jgi:hypothetical protein
VVVWQENPFANRLPEHLAAAEVLLRFKRSFDDLTRERRDEPQRGWPPAPEDRDELTERLLRHTKAVAHEERQLRERAGLDASPTLPALDGQPRLEVSSGNGGRWIDDETWGHDQPSVRFQGHWDPVEDDYDSVARFLDTDAAEAARHRLRHTVEQEIGSNLGSAAWNRPTALAGWVW